ncbi:MAG: acylphosphatase [Planctomycetales bacterium]|nr:acylphosphatase [Planctomycetales bacterium]
MANAPEQRVVCFQGHVQGVGFRYTTQRIASRLAVTGTVRNLPDGRVELVAEGEPREIDCLLSQIREQLAGYIRNEQTDTRPATGHFGSFEIAY